MSGTFTLSTPVVFFIYNRPEYTARVFDRITDAKPSQLFIVADGPADESDRERTEAARAVVEDITWSCDVKRLYASTNLGIKQRFVTGLEYVFNTVERAIILEDDTVPDPTFFNFCQTLLRRYQDDERIMEITGRNQLGTWRDNGQDYHFSYNGGIWGWATWSKYWDMYDPDMELWADPNAKDRVQDLIGDQWQYNHLKRVYRETYEGNNETWDYQWAFTRHINSGLSIVPSRNLIANIGFGEGATHTSDEDSPFAGTPVYSMDFPLNHPDYIVVDRDYDQSFHRLRPGRWKVHPIVYPIWERMRSLVNNITITHSMNSK
ncbi:glycosyltransferase family 2 protein [Halorubrum sp. DM2]|uniref:glycosyltransferase family 2 protein n=1 Tax=Halorubrum sp. DM2 TaxID=2527867 RepID=UPI0024B87713|nr:glycosyltransferase family 2 protein [Halorubrum sp. DM2]